MFKRTLLLCALSTALLASACADPEAAKREYLESGNRFFDEMKYGEAIVQYRNAIREDPRFAEARVKLAEAYERNGDAARAYGEFIRAADLLPEDVALQVKAVRYLLRARRYEDAKTRVEAVLARDPKNLEAQVLRGNALASLGDFDAAVADVEQALELDPGSVDAYTLLAGVKVAQGLRDQAREAFEKAVAADPRSIQARLALANFHLTTGGTAPAEETLKEALGIDPTNAAANRALAALYLGTNRASEAEPYLKVVAEGGGPPAAKLRLADYYIAQKRTADAEQLLKPLIEDATTWGLARLRFAQIEYNAKRIDRAYAVLNEILDREPANLNARLVKGRWLLAERKHSDALEQIQAVAKAEPRSVAAHYLLGSIHSQTGDLEAAVASFTEVLRLNPRATAAQLQLSRLQLARGDVSAAAGLAENLATTTPTLATRFHLARTLLAKGQTASAERELRPLLREFPKTAGVHALNGLILTAKKDVAGARSAYERALQIDPRSVESLFGLTMLDVEQKKFADARARLARRMSADPNNVALLLLSGRFELIEKNFSAAEQTLRRVIELSPNESDAYTLLGQTYLAQKKLDAARNEFEQLVRRRPNNIQAHTMVAMILQMQNNVVEAKKKYQETVNLDRRAAVAANNLAWLYAEAGENLDEALTLAQAALAERPDQPEIQDTLGWVYYRKELAALAVGAFEQSITKDPDNPTYHYHLALALAKDGNLARARQAVERALVIKPDYADAQKLLASLRG